MKVEIPWEVTLRMIAATASLRADRELASKTLLSNSDRNTSFWGQCWLPGTARAHLLQCSASFLSSRRGLTCHSRHKLQLVLRTPVRKHMLHSFLQSDRQVRKHFIFSTPYRQELHCARLQSQWCDFPGLGNIAEHSTNGCRKFPAFRKIKWSILYVGATILCLVFYRGF